MDKIRVIYVPAVRDPSKQLKNASGSLMYQIMNNINWSDEIKNLIKTNLQERNAQLGQERGVSIFGTSIASQWKEDHSDNHYSTANLRNVPPGSRKKNGAHWRVHGGGGFSSVLLQAEPSAAAPY